MKVGGLPFRFLRWSAVHRLFGLGVDYSDCARSWIFFEGGGGDRERSFEEANRFTRREAEVVIGVYFAEVAALDVDVFGEGDLM